MKSKVLQLLQSPDQSNQKLGLILYESQGCSQAKEWFDGLDQIYKIKYSKKSESKDDLLDLFNEKVLSLSSKKLFDLPKSINLLINLTDLYLNNNQLTSIPPEIGALFNLKWLGFYNNQITSIPSEFSKLTNLRWLVLDNNSIPEGQIDYLKIILPKNCMISH